MQVPSAAPYAVRPTFRVVGAVLLAYVAWLSLSDAIAAFSAESVALTCAPRKHQWACEAGMWLVQLFPVSTHGTIFALTDTIVAVTCLFLAVLLLLGLRASRPLK